MRYKAAVMAQPCSDDTMIAWRLHDDRMTIVVVGAVGCRGVGMNDWHKGLFRQPNLIRRRLVKALKVT